MCEYCEVSLETESYGTVECISLDNPDMDIKGAAMIANGNNRLCGRMSNDDGGTWLPFSIDINYCPMCGRKLSEVDDG